MSKKAIWLVTAVLVLLWAMAALLVRAEEAVGPTRGDILAAARRLLEPTIPLNPTIPVEPTATETPEPTETPTLMPSPTATPEMVRVQVSLTGGPTTLCPGYNLYYTFRLTNTSTLRPLTNLVITDAVPLGTWYAVGGLGGTISGTYDSEINAVIWRAAIVNPRQMIEAKLTLRTYTSLRTGTIISNTFAYTAVSLAEPGAATLASVVDIRACPKTNTPTPTRTATRTSTATHTATATATALKGTETPTPSSTRWRYYLSLIYKGTRR